MSNGNARNIVSMHVDSIWQAWQAFCSYSDWLQAGPHAAPTRHPSHFPARPAAAAGKGRRVDCVVVALPHCSFHPFCMETTVFISLPAQRVSVLVFAVWRKGGGGGGCTAWCGDSGVVMRWSCVRWSYYAEGPQRPSVLYSPLSNGLLLTGVALGSLAWCYDNSQSIVMVSTVDTYLLLLNTHTYIFIADL